jgi:superfamily II DNA or RNA helicase
MLREYQINFVTNIRKALQHSKRIIACAATGAGKTKTFLSMADSATAKNAVVLIITESRKIFVQIAAERKNAYNIKAGIKHIWIEPANIYVAMAQTLVNRPFIIEQLQRIPNLLIINDEAHIGTATKLLKQLPDAYLIGFTATPDYKVAKHLPEIYKGIVVGPQPQELVEMGFLSPYYHYEKKSVDLSNLKVKGGEFTEQSQFEAFEKPQVFAGLHQDLSNHPYKKCIIFCSSIKHCHQLTNELREVGYIVAEVHSENKNSDIELSQFMHSNVDICVSVGILTKGFDFPEIDLVILQRATRSLALYCQMVGRGSRSAPNKKRFTVLDYGGNASRHGLWNFEHEWQTKWLKPSKKKKEGVAPVKECPKCFLMLASRVMICSECGHIFEKKETMLVEGELVEVTNEYNLIRGKYISELTPKELALYAKTTNKKAFAIRVAKAKHQEEAEKGLHQNEGIADSFLHLFSNEMGYHFRWVDRQQVGTEKIEYYNIKIK